MQHLADNNKQQPSPTVRGWTGTKPNTSCPELQAAASPSLWAHQRPKVSSLTSFPARSLNLLCKWPRAQREGVKLSRAGCRREDKGLSPKRGEGVVCRAFPLCPEQCLPKAHPEAGRAPAALGGTTLPRFCCGWTGCLFLPVSLGLGSRFPRRCEAGVLLAWFPATPGKLVLLSCFAEM